MLHKIALLTLAPLALFAQAGVTFTYQVSGATAAAPLASGGTIVYPVVAAGSASLVTIYCSNQSQSSYSLSAAVNNPLFTVSPASAQLAAGASSAIGVTFTPQAAGSAGATMSVILTGASGGSQVARFTLSAQAVDGVVASFAFASDGNQTPLPDGGTIPFPATAPGAQASATFTISNRSSASVSIDSLLLSGTAFHLTGLPLMPVAVASGSQISVGIVFSPSQAGSFSGSLTYAVSGASHSVSLSGVAAASSLQFTIAGGTPQTLQPGATIALPSTGVGTPTMLSIQIGNSGTASAVISTLSASPSVFQLQNAPALPLTIPAGASATVGLAFVPQSPGNTTGVLTIGNATFVLSGGGLGAQLSCTVTPRGQAASPCGASTITLPPTSLGDQLPFTVQVTNTGNQPGTVQNFTIGGTGFSVVSAPSLPATLAPGDSIQLNASFAPAVLGITGGYLQINAQTTNITVAATAPPALPAVTFTNASAQMQPLAQPSIGIHLASAYPYDLAGTLSLTFTADSLVDDPSIQFLNGQRYIDFTLPAGATDAVFGTTATGVMLQTGSTAGVITLAASFTLGSYVVTGSTPVTQNITIPEAAPQILSLQIGSMDTSGFTLLLTGLSTGRSLTLLAFTLTPAGNSSLATTTLTADVSAAFNTWFSSTLSHSFGGQFTVSVTFNVAGDVAAIQAVAATATNAQGTSSPNSVTLQASGVQ
jgi:hypothetical protein